MCDICHEGGQVLGPFLKPMTPPRPHRVPPRRPHHAATRARCCATRCTPPRSPARPVRERLPADQAATRPRAAATTAPRWPCSAATRDGGPVVDSPIVIRTADVDLDGQAHGDRRRDPGPRLRPGRRGGRDARQGRRHPQRLRAGAARRRPQRQRRRAGPRRGRAARPQLAQPAAVDVLAHRPGRRAARPAAARQARRDPRRRGRLRQHAAPRARRAGHDQRGRPSRRDYADGPSSTPPTW